MSLIDNRARLTAADRQQQLSGTLQSNVLKRRVNATLIAMRRVGMQTVTTGATGDRKRIEVSTLKQDVLRLAVHTRMFATKNTGHRQRFLIIGDH